MYALNSFGENKCCNYCDRIDCYIAPIACVGKDENGLVLTVF